jgi:hypothetical protein
MHTGETLLVLFDNGSLRPAPALQLRQIADKVGFMLGRAVTAASVLHSDKIPAGELGGQPFPLVEQVARAFMARQPGGEILLVPAFFGPSRAITHHLPGRLDALSPRPRWRMAPCLVDCANAADEGAPFVAAALAGEARRVIAAHNLSANAAKILLVDHGSPERAVTDVRERLGAQLRALLGAGVAHVGVASMERRGGERYVFNEPLLAGALRAPPFDDGDVVVLLQFLSPGRHAGANGDIAAICEAARAVRPGLRAWRADPIGGSPEIAELLRKRFAALLRRGG